MNLLSGRPSSTPFARLLLGLLAPCAGVCAAESSILLRDVTQETGITFRHTDGGSGRRYIVETVTAGLALFDYDGDGDTDVYFLNGAPLLGTEAGPPPTNRLYRNEGGFRFTDVTDAAGVGDPGFSLGVAAGDYDGDGDLDLYVNNFGPNVLYRNNGDGTFTDVTRNAGVGGGQKVGAGVAFLDMDKDGDLDLFVANYVRFSYEKHIPRSTRGHPNYPGPLDYEPEPDTLFRNNGDGTFEDVSVASGIRSVAGTGMGLVCADYDNDGDTDIVVANDVKQNFLYENDGTGRFEEVGLLRGIGYDSDGHAQGSMGVDCGDFDNDGFLDFHVTSFARELALLYRSVDEYLEDVTPVTGDWDVTFPYVTWGNGFVDFDNDGHRDIFIACGDIDDNVELFDDTRKYEAPNFLFRNAGNGRFVNVSGSSGDGLAVRRSSRGAAFDDLDGDGDIDGVIQNSRREPTILKNETPLGNRWIQVSLRGTKTNRHGVGARVKVVAGDLTQYDEVHSGRGYQSHWGMVLHFGLGKRDRVERIEVRWVGGGVDVYRDIAVNRQVVLTEGGTAGE